MLLRNSRVSLRPPGLPWYRAVGTLAEENAFRHVGSPGHSISITTSARRLSEHPKQRCRRRLQVTRMFTFSSFLPVGPSVSAPALLKL